MKMRKPKQLWYNDVVFQLILIFILGTFHRQQYQGEQNLNIKIIDNKTIENKNNDKKARKITDKLITKSYRTKPKVKNHR